MDPTTADFNAWLAEEGAKIGATVPPQPSNLLAMYGTGYVPADTAYEPTTADILAQAQRGTAIGNWLRSMAPEVRQADDSSVASGILSRLARTGTGMVHSGLNTAANWLEKRPEIGPDTLAPLGLAPMGMALTPKNAIGSTGGKLPQGAPMVRDLESMKPASSDAARPTYRDHALAEGQEDLWAKSQISGMSEWSDRMYKDPLDWHRRMEAGFDFLADKSPSKYLNADNARASVPGTVINSLDMSEASRLQRAREMGFNPDETWYHGTQQKFDSFKPSEDGTLGPGVYLTTDEKHAQHFTGNKRGARGEVLPTHIRGRIATWEDVPPEITKVPFFKEMFGGTSPAYEAAKWAQENGYSGFRLPMGEAVVFDPKNIRRTDAAFDPAQSHSANLLASDTTRSSVPGTVVNAQEDEDKKKRKK